MPEALNPSPLEFTLSNLPVVRTAFVARAVLVAGALLLQGLAASPGRAEPVAHWLLDELSGTQAADVSSGALHGAVQGGAQWTGGVWNGALSLDGIDDLVVMQAVPALDLATRLTLSLWIRPSSLDGNRSLISKDGVFELDLSHAGAGSYSLRLDNLRRGAGTTLLDAGSWHHVAVTWDGSTVRYYHQGLADGTATFVGSLPANSKDLGLGGRPADFAAGLPRFLFEGLLDDVRIYDRALSDAEILAVYQNQPLPPAPADFDPPVPFDGEPAVALPFGTTSAELRVRTDESAECRFDTQPGVDWLAMGSIFSVTGGTYHAETVGSLQNGALHTFYVRCRDTAGNAAATDYEISFAVDGAPPLDLDPPQPFSPSPVGTVEPGVQAVDLELVTDEAAECRYAPAPGMSFETMPFVFQQTGGTDHRSTVGGLQDGSNRRFYIRCRDAAGNVTAEDFVLGFWQASPPPGNGFHPSDLADIELFVESRHGLVVATCKTEACEAAGDNVPLAAQYCDTSTFPDGCVRRWEDVSPYAPPQPFEPPEWVHGRDHGQDDLDKPGLILDCLNGRPCLRGGFGRDQYRGLEIEPNQYVGPIAGPFSLVILARPVAQAEDFYYLGFAGSELLHEVDDDSLRLRLGFGNQIPLTDAGSVAAHAWHLIEIYRDAGGALTALVDGYEQTVGTPSSLEDFYFRFLMTTSRTKGMEGDLAAALVLSQDLAPASRQALRDYFAAVYGLTLGAGGAPPNPGGGDLPSDGLVAFWSFDDAPSCSLQNHVPGAPAAGTGPGCPGNAPTATTGVIGSAAAFDGIDDGATAAAGSGLDNLSQVTISAWVRTTETTEYRSMVDKRDAATDGFDLYLSPGGKPFLRINDKALQGTVPVADGAWHHVAGVYDGSSMWLYVDGALDTGRVAGAQVLATTAPTSLGIGYALGPNKLHGELDQVRIYDRGLETWEIVALAAEGEADP